MDETRVGLTPAEVEAAMQEIIDSQVFEVDGLTIFRFIQTKIITDFLL
ncbi:DUF2922 family protein [Sporosarcina thermotolerans]|uniref:DUF2922 family protein n=1 Tax=Sporosarcina thermotolerans TaxID=633404 RepID=A0AAW9AC62_9BACL|nr:DUF2922 family protein [Sporosarcina thermotolerans]MDW0117201.1 DUF2922 family protein [Sporosarcina thermotolerans]WHT47372.1 DUF2922 family protein [Sporosarcina thermotolerans]